MDMILLDWTRMGRSYCLAGAVLEKGDWRIVRPLPMKHRAAPVRNIGWSPFLFDGHARWEIFELIGKGHEVHETGRLTSAAQSEDRRTRSEIGSGTDPLRLP